MNDISKKSQVFSLVMLGALYFVFGLVSWVNSILVPYFKISCELQSEVQGYLANFAFYIAYLVMTIPASALPLISFAAADDIEIGRGNRIPLWLFGFLY